MDALKRSLAAEEEKAPEPATKGKKPKKRVAGQREMLLGRAPRGCEREDGTRQTLGAAAQEVNPGPLTSGQSVHIVNKIKGLTWRGREKPGRAKGHPKTGGRAKGGVDKIKRKAILAAQGITPLDYMMMLVRAETEQYARNNLAVARRVARSNFY